MPGTSCYVRGAENVVPGLSSLLRVAVGEVAQDGKIKPLNIGGILAESAEVL